MSGGRRRDGRGGRGPWPMLATALQILALQAGILTLAPGGPSAAQGFLREPPELAAQAARGVLPPVARRLPGNPMLLQVEEEIGSYGGIWRIAMTGASDGLLLYRSLGYEHLVRWDPAWRRIIPNVAQSFQVADDARRFTFRLRPGLRWSDGEPFTAEDIRFWFEDVLLDPELTREPPRWMPGGDGNGGAGRGVRLEVPDPHTVRFVFDRPNSLFLGALAAGQPTGSATDYPRHALARYHKRHNPSGIAAEVAAAGVNDWAELFHLKARTRHGRSDAAALLRRPPGDLSAVQAAERIPTLDAWVLDRREPGDPPRYVAVRNPYYWKVDPAGHQLPYIDRVEVLETDPEGVFDLLRSRRVGMQARHVASPPIQNRLPELLERGYRAVPLVPAGSNAMPLVFNVTHPDPARRALLGDRALRIALSRAIDRPAIIAAVFGGRGVPYQVAPRPESTHRSDRLGLQHLDHDPAAASAILDSLGLSGRDAEGFRLDRDGCRVSFTLLVRRDRPYQEAVGAIVAQHWRQVGVELVVESLHRAAMEARIADGRFDIVPGTADGGMDAIQEAYAYAPLTHDSVFGLPWVRWRENPAAPGAEEPPPAVKRQWDIHRRIQETADPEAQHRLAAELLDSAAEEFVQIGIAQETTRYAVARNDFRNVPRLLWDSWLYPTPAPTNPAQYYIDAP